MTGLKYKLRIGCLKDEERKSKQIKMPMNQPCFYSKDLLNKTIFDEQSRKQEKLRLYGNKY